MHAAGRKGNRRNEDSERQQDMMGGRISEKEFRDSRPFMRQAGKIRTVRGSRTAAEGENMCMKIVDMHCDTIAELLERRRGGSEEGLRQNRLHVDLEKMKKGGYLLQNFALFVELSEKKDPLEEVLELADLYYEQMEKNADLIRPVYRYDEIEKNARDGFMSALLTIEEGGVCKGNPAVLRILYRLGVRMMTLTWNFPNELGCPNLEQPPLGKEKGFVPDFRKLNKEQGLTETGFAFIEEMERLGMIVDVSHLSDAGFWDVAKAARKPFVASHSNARSVCGWVRNLDDEMIRCLAQKGGVMGLNFCPAFLTDTKAGEEAYGSIAALVEHAKHIVRVGGEECLGLGSDYDGIRIHDELPDASYLPLLEDALKKGGFTPSQIEKIFSQNVLRLYREILK